MGETNLIGLFGCNPKVQLVDFFIENILHEFSKSEVIKITGMARSTIYKYWPEFVKFGIIIQKNKSYRNMQYSLNQKSSIVKALLKLDFELTTVNWEGFK